MDLHATTTIDSPSTPKNAVTIITRPSTATPPTRVPKNFFSFASYAKQFSFKLSTSRYQYPPSGTSITRNSLTSPTTPELGKT